MSYVLINPLQQVLSFDEYKKALAKAEAFEKQHTFAPAPVKKRGRPVGTTKKEKPETPPEPKKRGRPPKAKAEEKAEAKEEKPKPVGRPPKKAEAKAEAKAEVKPVGRPAKIDDYFDFRTAMTFNDDLKGQGWFQEEDTIDRILRDHFKDTKSIRLQNGIFEVYDEKKGWIVRSRISTPEERAEGKPKMVLDPEVVIEDTWNDLSEWGGVPFDWYLTHPDNEKEFMKKKNKIKAIIKQFLIKRFGM